MILKKIIIGVVFIVFCFSSIAQNVKLQCIGEKDIENIDKITIKLYKSAKCSNSKTQEVNIINILYLGYDGKYEKSDFLSKKFLDKLQPYYYYYKRNLFTTEKILHTSAYICNNEGKVLALTDTRSLMCREDFKESVFIGYDTLINKINKLKSIYVFCIGPLGTYFCIDNKNIISVLEYNKEGLKEYTLENYINERWEEFAKNQ